MAVYNIESEQTQGLDIIVDGLMPVGGWVLFSSLVFII